MRRDDVEITADERALALTSHETGSSIAGIDVQREPMYFEGAGHALFGWYHDAPAAAPHDAVAVICPPAGYEYTRSHRSLRHLADRLARRGIPALRFDYHGIGDSPGSDLDPARWQAWQASVAAAIAQARRISGRERVCLVGVRLGASLAALVAARTPVDLLVLWNACVTGKPYLRELQAIAASAEDGAPSVEGIVESGGFAMTEETRDAIMALDLASVDFRAGRVLVASRDDMPQDKGLVPQLGARGVAFDHERLPGWSGMMADHSFTVVPDAALDRIAAWVEAHSGRAAAARARHVEHRRSLDLPSGVEESAHRFGEGGRLFGILSRNGDTAGRPLVILFNGGAVHHVGPNRIYVDAARALAANGIACLRMDLETLGDSVLDGAWRENYPYPRTALRDVSAAFAFARELGYPRVIPAGLCSGSHMAFHAALDASHACIEEILLLNPLVYYWEEGMNLDTSTKFEDMEQYRKSARDPERWKKLLRGEVKMKRLAEVLAGHALGLVKPYWDTAQETVFPDRGGTRLSRDLRKLVAMKRPVAFFLGDRDQGLKILNAEARRTFEKGLASGLMTLYTVAGGDHTFSRLKPRLDLVRAVVQHCVGARRRG